MITASREFVTIYFMKISTSTTGSALNVPTDHFTPILIHHTSRKRVVCSKKDTLFLIAMREIRFPSQNSLVQNVQIQKASSSPLIGSRSARK